MSGYARSREAREDESMNQLLIVANWKMNPATLKDAEKLFSDVKRGLGGIKNVETVICPPFLYISSLKSQVSSFMKLGGQDCFYEQKGAYTGEVSPAMLKDIGCEYVIVGHSERKQYFGETDEVINKKVKAALKAGLKVILCIGEDTRDSFDSRGHWTHELDPRLKEQLIGALGGVKKSQLDKVVVVYEPVWAIGSGKTATADAASPDDVLAARIFIKKIIASTFSRKDADKMRILYGGSTDKKNARGFIEGGQADGLLVGGSSLDADEFVAMVKSVI